MKALPTVWSLNNHLNELMLELAALQMIHNVKCLLSQQTVKIMLRATCCIILF